MNLTSYYWRFFLVPINGTLCDIYWKNKVALDMTEVLYALKNKKPAETTINVPLFKNTRSFLFYIINICFF